jgi:hypothetical protein
MRTGRSGADRGVPLNAGVVHREERLVGPGAGGGTVRLGDTVRRPPERAPAAMRLVLQHLEEVGFDGSPRLLGRDEHGRWILTYIPGDVAMPPWLAWVVADTTLVSVARLLRRFHQAVAGLRPPTGMRWPTTAPSGYEGSVVGHMDASMANVVCRCGEAVALIDFEEVGMVAPVWDVVRTARHWVPLIDPKDLTGRLRSLAGRQAERLRLFLDTYDLGDDDRARLPATPATSGSGRATPPCVTGAAAAGSKRTAGNSNAS